MTYRDSIGFVGGGNMAEALMGGILRSRLQDPSRIVVAEPRGERRKHLLETFGVRVTPANGEAVKQGRTLILAVKPQVLPQVLDEVGPGIEKGQLLVSIAAGTTLSFLEARLPQVPVVRCMPNTPALVGAGATVLSPGRWVDESMIDWVRTLFSSVGLSIVLPEGNMDAVTGLSGSGPAYVFRLAEAMTAAGVAAGLPEEDSGLLARQTILGAARMMAETQQTPASLREMVTSPGGTTQAGLKVLDDGGFTDLVVRTVAAAARRSRELGGKDRGE